MKNTPETILLLRTLVPSAKTRLTLVFLFWIGLGTISAVQWWYLYFGQQPYTWWVLFRAKMIVWLLWGAVTPAILWFGSKFPVERPAVVRHLFILLLVSIVVSAVYIGMYAAAVYLNFPPDFPSAPGGFWKLVHWIYWNHFSYFYLGFWVVIAVEQMLRFSRRSHDRELATRELSRQLTEARLTQLKSQIHPHFLFNTLNAISSLITQSERDRAFDMVSRLSRLLRLGLEHGERRNVPLSQEIAFVEEYLSLMALRFPDRLKSEISVGPGSRDILVPSLLLQPLVENAVKFGTMNGDGVTTIEVSSAMSSGKMILTVSNTRSVGADANGPQTSGEAEGIGLGLRNTRDRLALLFGDAYSLEVAGENSPRTTVTISIPTAQQA